MISPTPTGDPSAVPPPGLLESLARLPTPSPSRRRERARTWGVVLGGGGVAGPRGALSLPRAVLQWMARSLPQVVVSGEPRTLDTPRPGWGLHPLSKPIPASLLVSAPLSSEGESPAAPPSLIETLEREALPYAVARDPFLPLRATSPSLAPLLAALERVAGTPLPVLVLGETGTGKELVARALHAASGRPGPFVAENCAALPEGLLEAELFGVRRGAFTGAERDRKGRIAEAHRGTLFLDEVADLPLALQAKLLRVLQEREIRPLGGERPQRIDLRIVAATHASLLDDARRGTFRLDLYYRLAGFTCEIPPLRERLPDLPYLCRTLLSRARDEGVGPGERIDGEGLERLGALPFPGNVRELENLLRRASALSRGPRIEPDDLGAEGAAPAQNLESRMILQALRLSGGVKAEAARRLGWSRQKLYRRITALGLRPAGAPPTTTRRLWL